MTWTEPDRVVVELAGSLPPGRVLDIGAGDGHDSLWLAERGWSATAVDLSRHSVRKLRAIAKERELDVTAVQVDAADLGYQAEFDLALVCYIHVPADVRAKICAGAIRALRPGGLLLWRSFEAGMPGDPGFDRALLPAREDLLSDLGDAVSIERAGTGDEYFPYMEQDMFLLTVIARRNGSQRHV
ncbi:MAG: class I SAM-dependent methyltransferase [Thermomicrobiales bacterium]